mmetsp:Transcript_16761/g.32628  ORF Transcript_16761/g.32628 Transcript_16761/m.32628 type:complete len:200 (+) Transcript_16761:785-1384(+)
MVESRSSCIHKDFSSIIKRPMRWKAPSWPLMFFFSTFACTCRPRISLRLSIRAGHHTPWIAFTASSKDSPRKYRGMCRSSAASTSLSASFSISAAAFISRELTGMTKGTCSNKSSSKARTGARLLSISMTIRLSGGAASKNARARPCVLVSNSCAKRSFAKATYKKASPMRITESYSESPPPMVLLASDPKSESSPVIS